MLVIDIYSSGEEEIIGGYVGFFMGVVFRSRVKN